MMHEKILATPKEAAEILGLPVSTIRYLYTYEPSFPAVKIRERYYIPIDKAKEWIEKSAEEGN